MKWPNRFHIWRYRRYRRQNLFNRRRKEYIDVLASRLNFINNIPLKSLTYRQRRGYKLEMLTESLGELIEITQEISERIEYRSYGIDRMEFQQYTRREVDYDYYLVDTDNRPYHESDPEFSELLKDVLHPLIGQLRSLRYEDEVLYAYYERVLRALFDDWDNFLDTTVRLQIGMEKA